MPVIGQSKTGQPITDFTRRKLVSRIWPRLRGTATISVRIGSQEELDGSVTWAAAQTFSASQQYLDFEVSGRLPAFEFSSQSNAGWQLEGYDYEVSLLGSH